MWKLKLDNWQYFRNLANNAAKSRYSIVGKIIFTILIFIYTFPSFEPDLAPGLDSSYVWGLNWLFANDYPTLSQLIYPIGPLALLKLPAIEGHNFIIFLIVYSVLKLWFITSCFRLAETYSQSLYYAAVLTLLASYFAGIDIMIVFLCIMLCFRSIKTNSTGLFIIATLLAFGGLFIKTSIGMEALSVVFIAWLMNFYKNRNFRSLIMWALSVATCAIVVGIAVLHDFTTLINYYWGTLHLVSGYGGALALHPGNNWLALIAFILIIVSFPIFSGDKDSKIIFFLSLIPLFASWKHAFVREDITHYQAIVTFTITFWCIILMIKKLRKSYTVIFALLSVMMLFFNMKESVIYNVRKIENYGMKNFISIIFEYDDFTKRMNDITENAMADDKLPEEIISELGNSTVDFYPWEHLYAKENSLNWHPRKTIEIGASTSKWLSDLASENYAGDNSVEYVLWHFNKKCTTIDDRYVLNDEPNVVYNILQNYNANYYGDKYILWKKREVARDIQKETGELVVAKIDEWIPVPDCGDHIQRIKVEGSVSFAGFLKRTFFKDEMYYVDYSTQNGEIYSYRYVPSTAVDGLWINPLVTDIVNGEIADKIEKVRFRVSNSSCVKDEISVQFETWDIAINDIIKIVNDSSTYLYVNTFETEEPYVTDEYTFSGKYSNIVEPQGFSCTYQIAMDSLWTMLSDSTDIDLKASCQFINTGSSQLVVSIDDSENKLYEYRTFENTDTINWTLANLNCRINRKDHPTGLLKVYVWNNGNYPTYVDDMKVSVAKVRKK